MAPEAPGGRMTDPVNRPAHYNQGDVECIDAIRAQLSDEEWRGYLRGQVAKYNWRLGRKDALEQDARKLRWYASWLCGVDPRK
jgi:hypothetical protein